MVHDQHLFGVFGHVLHTVGHQQNGVFLLSVIFQDLAQDLIGPLDQAGSGFVKISTSGSWR